MLANRFGSAIRFRFICTRRLRQSRSDRIWRVSVAASLRAFVPRSPQFLKGSRAAASGAMAAGLATMVASMSRGKKAYVQYEPELSDAIARLSQLREELKTAIDADANSYNAAKSSAEGDGLIDAALKQATSVPLSVAERAKEVAEIADKLKPITNPNMKSDLTTASALARAAIEGALANVDINLESVKDQHFAGEIRKRAITIKS